MTLQSDPNLKREHLITLPLKKVADASFISAPICFSPGLQVNAQAFEPTLSSASLLKHYVEGGEGAPGGEGRRHPPEKQQ